MKSQVKSKVLQARIEEQTLKDFQMICGEMSINPSELVRQWVSSFVKNHDSIARKSIPGEIPVSYSLPRSIARA